MRFFNGLKTALLLGALMGLCMLVGRLIGGPIGLVYGFLFGAVGNFVSFFFSDKIALASVGAQEVTPAELPWLHAMVADLCQRAGLPMPRVYVFPQAAPNAFATGRGPKHAAVAVSSGMIENFPQREIEGVLGHELTHVLNRDVLTGTIAATMAGAISSLAYMAMWFGGGSRDRDSGPLGAIAAILAIVFAPIAAMILQMAISRQREYAADEGGGRLCGDPNKLADALVRLEGLNQRIPTQGNPAYSSLFIMAPLSGKSLASLFSTHPPTEERIARLHEQAMRNR